MSTLKVNTLEPRAGTTVTIASGNTLAGTDIIGTTQITDISITNAKLADMAANTVKVRDANSSGVPSDKALATTEILIGDGTGFTTASLSSDVTMTNAGAVTIAANAVTLAKLEDGTQGDILYYGASGAPTRLGFGTSGDFLKTQGTGANPVWATAGGGLLLQVLTVLKTDTFTTTSTSNVDITGLTLTITPSAATSRIFISGMINYGQHAGTAYIYTNLMRDDTSICQPTSFGSRNTILHGTGNPENHTLIGLPINFIDSPNTTSATVYKVQMRSSVTHSQYVNRSYTDTDNYNYPRAASSFTVMEIGV